MIAVPNAGRSVGSTSSPLRPCSICSAMPPTREPTTGRSFHIASVTVRPKPSARLFCTTTSARRCRAFTTTAFSTRSSTGRLARWVRSRASGGKRPLGGCDLPEHRCALGVVGDRVESSGRRARGAPRARPARSGRTPRARRRDPSDDPTGRPGRRAARSRARGAPPAARLGDRRAWSSRRPVAPSGRSPGPRSPRPPPGRRRRREDRSARSWAIRRRCTVGSR